MTEAQFWARVDKVDGDGCWVWNGARVPEGYGQAVYEGKVHGAHRLAWMFDNRERQVPAGMKVLHRCDNPPCVRPSHLFLGTNGDNMRDCVRKGRMPHAFKAGNRGGRMKKSYRRRVGDL